MCYIDSRRMWNITPLPKCWLSFWEIWCVFFTKKSFYYQGFFAVKRRAVFILGAMWWALVRGWRRDCVVGGMETRFQWRKEHSCTAKCEAFHVAPRLFFMFFVFDYIHDSATMHNLSPRLFHWAEKCPCGALVRWCVCRYVKKCLMFWFACYNSWIFS